MASESDPPAELKWAAQFKLARHTRNTQLPGDKLLLPPSALEQLLAAAPVVTVDSNRPHITAFDPFNPYTFDAERQYRAQLQDRHQQLPHPLTFRLVNPDNGRVIYAGIREFSAEEGEVVLSSFLREALGVETHYAESSRRGSPNGHKDEDDTMTNGVEQPAVNGVASINITVHAKQLPKGTFVKLRPLEPGYDPEDWKSLLEEHLRSNFTTLTQGEVLVVYGGRGLGGKRDEFRFLVDGFKPEGDGICVVDTDLEVDIEALNEEQARETLKRIAAKRQRAPGTTEGSSTGGIIDIFQAQDGQVLEGDYVNYELPSWDRSQGLEISLDEVDDDDEVDLFVSPYSSRQQVRPREDEHVFADVSSRYPKRIRLQPTNIELDEADAVWISVHAYPSASPSTTPKPFRLKVSMFDPKTEAQTGDASTEATHNPDEVQCKNCTQWVPKGSLFLHENFCLRNNILCPQGCGQVFQKRSPAFQDHWHCPQDTFTGNTPFSRQKHDAIYHTEQSCVSCGLDFPSVPTLAHHKTTTCPGKLILCRFCHLQVPQEGDPSEPPNPELLLSGLTPHELADGGRTTECHLCNKIVRFRDMDTHLRHHNLERLSRPSPRLCRNLNCGRTQDGANKLGDTRSGTRKGQGPGNEIGLCSVCFGPLYVSLHDPEGKALRRRIERRYLSQLLTGCGKAWCRNEYCRSGRKNLGQADKSMPTKDAIPLVKQFLEGMDGRGYSTPLHFCVDERSQKSRTLAEMLGAEKGIEGKGGFGLEWCVAALEAEGGDLDRARNWLKGWAPQRSEAGH
ncbi:ubiquitin fusion degradation protein-like protein [Cucurbitaria berberidis CBS 394.84]|uniref:Ubiquitin fusion degradation protein-like protein n=1 Tax=Cucurbitaria berberidis CBS 394.84 TaxID=1168544 RepID=A0A9P4GB59_9PLEO|nr:ubiquitin fusion degradation protein-like protein [Cucurbitaria berberidis CBS 394.84]KAF1842387.1 ubiquitin fusion degradation protein-like protein [Cucurbitaria berberidis CBS 394.84]